MTPYISLSLVSFVVNLPLGYIREYTRKYSLAWIVMIHASIPLIIYLRLSWQTSRWFIPATIAFAVLGQLMGSRINKKFRQV